MSAYEFEWMNLYAFLGCFQLLQRVRNDTLYKQQHMNFFVPHAKQLIADSPLSDWLGGALGANATWEEKAADALQSWKNLHLQRNLIHIK